MANSGQFARATLIATMAVVGMMGLCLSPVQAQECPGLDLGTLRSSCLRYVLKPGPKIQPSAACCGVARNINVPCACRVVNKDVEKVLSIEKVIYVAQYCGLSLPHGFRCGSYTIP